MIKKQRRFKTRYRLWRKQNGICPLCDEAMLETDVPRIMVLTIDHIVPRARGGSNNERNIQLTHIQCNIDKGSNMPVGITLFAEMFRPEHRPANLPNFRPPLLAGTRRKKKIPTIQLPPAPDNHMKSPRLKRVGFFPPVIEIKPGEEVHTVKSHVKVGRKPTIIHTETGGEWNHLTIFRYEEDKDEG